MPNTKWGNPYPLPTDMVRNGAAAIQALAERVPGTNAAAGYQPGIWATHAGLTTDAFGMVAVTPSPAMSVIYFAGTTLMISAADQLTNLAAPVAYRPGTPNAGPSVTFRYMHNGAWMANQFIVAWFLVIGI